MRLPTLVLLPVALAACLDERQSTFDAAVADAQVDAPIDGPAAPDVQGPDDVLHVDAPVDVVVLPDVASPPDVAPPDAPSPPDAAAPTPDAAPPPDAPPPVPDAAPGPHRHTITIDGVNDFDPATESFATTTSGYTVWITWDDAALYAGTSGPDIAGGSTSKWVLIYIDSTAGGSTSGETYNTQTPTFPASFTADYYLGWKTDNTFQQLRAFSGTSWTSAPGIVTTFQSGTFVETRIALADLGATSAGQLRIATFLLDEAAFAEWSYAGLYPGSFTDGYHPSIPISYYLDADFTSSSAPNDPTNRAP